MAANKRKILEAARKLLQKGSHERALKEYHKLLKLDPRDAKLRLEIGDAYRRWGQVDEAVDTYTKVAEQYMSEGFDARAVAVFKQIQNLDPDRYSSYAPLAELYQRMGLTSEAIAALQTAADGYHREGNQPEALRLLRRMAALDPTNTTSRIKIADLLRQQGMNDEALEEYRAASDELERQGDVDAAAGSLERILEIDPNDAPTLARLARNRLARGDARRAEPLARRALERESSPEAFELMADVYRAQSRDDDVAETYRALAALYMERGQEDLARDIRQRFVPAEDFAAEASNPELPSRDDLQPELLDEQVLDEQVLDEDASGFLDDAEVLGDASGSGRDLEAGDLEVGFDAEAGDALFGEDTISGIRPGDSALPDEFLDDEPLLEGEGEGLGEAFGDIDLDELDVGLGAGELEEADPDARTRMAAPLPQADLDQLLAEASVYLRYGKRPQAIENLQSILAREPRHRAALEKLGEAHLAGAEPGRALDAWTSAARLAREAGDEAGFDLLCDRIAGLDASAATRLQGAQEAEPGEEPVLDVSIPNLSDPGEESAAETGGAEEFGAGFDLELELHDVEVDVEGLDDPDAFDEGLDSDASIEGEPPAPVVAAPAEPLPPDSSASFSMSQQILEDLEEADFYVQQGLLDEAEGIYRRLLERSPNHPRVLVRLGEIGAARGDAPGTGRSPQAAPAPAAGPVDPEDMGLVDRETGEFEVELPPCDLDEALAEPGAAREASPAPFELEVDIRGEIHLGTSDTEGVDSPETDGASAGGGELALRHQRSPDRDRPAPLEPHGSSRAPTPEGDPVLGGPRPAGQFDLAAELSEAFDDEGAGENAGSDSSDDAFSSVFREFKRGVSQALSEGDHEAHYDLGIAYREMGLMEDAMAEFRSAMQSPERRIDCLHLLGLCALELDRSDEAVGHLEQALRAPGIGREEELGVRFQLGRAFESLGDLERARGAFEAVASIDPLFCEVEQRLVRLDRSQKSRDGAGEAAEIEGWESFEDVIAEANRGEPDSQAPGSARPPGRRRAPIE